MKKSTQSRQLKKGKNEEGDFIERVFKELEQK